MPIQFTKTARNRLIVALAAIAALSLSVGPSSAQNIFNLLFGAARHALPPSANSFAAAPPQSLFGGNDAAEPGMPVGPSVSYCVRTCDGRYFPLQRLAGTTPAQTCSALCPASATKVYYGGNIDGARASDGARYGDLPNAFVYREKLVDGCTCNGKSPLGLAKVDPAADPTLRPGDMVNTATGLVAYRGRGSQTAQFTPVTPSDSASAARRIQSLR